MITKYLCKFLDGGYLIDSTNGKRVGNKYYATRFDSIDDLRDAVVRYTDYRYKEATELSVFIVEMKIFSNKQGQ